MYDVDTGALILECQQDWVCSVLWSRDGSRLFSADHKTIRYWNSVTGEQIGHPWTGHTDSIRSLSLSPDGWILASASYDKTVRFWDATTGDPVRQHLQHDERVNTVRFSPSGESVVSAGWDGKICLWRVPRLDSITHQVTTPSVIVMCVLALVLTVLQARPTLPGIEYLLRGCPATLRPLVPSLRNTPHTLSTAMWRLEQCRISAFKYVFLVACSTVI